ncbi:MAG: hypothetical protein IPO27_14355 [Bacteroidetes bacterium]|nr:hypothetical protein [Bacteroidota bacterium]
MRPSEFYLLEKISNNAGKIFSEERSIQHCLEIVLCQTTSIILNHGTKNEKNSMQPKYNI